MPPPMRVAFLHPELGIGGAERLVVDAARELTAAGHRATIFTLRHDRQHSFPETRDGRVDVRVQSSPFPARIGGRLRAPCAIVRAIGQARAFLRSRNEFDVVFCDLVANAVPVLRRAGVPVVFYCHFPDMLLAPRRRGALAPYRWMIDRAEERSMAAASLVLVNSAYTRAVLRRVFPRLRQSPLEIAYPGIDPARFAAIRSRPSETGADGQCTIASIGRFDPAKNLGLAVDALVESRAHLDPATFRRVRLVFAGGVDDRLAEQRETVASLRERAARAGVAEQVALWTSPSDATIRSLLSQSRCLVHTARHEPFGYAPLEAMAAGRPVIAANAAGPAETVRDGETGFLRSPSPRAFAAALSELVADPALADRLGAAARRRVETEFSRAAFGRRIESLLRRVVSA